MSRMIPASQKASTDSSWQDFTILKLQVLTLAQAFRPSGPVTR